MKSEEKEDKCLSCGLYFVTPTKNVRARERNKEKGKIKRVREREKEWLRYKETEKMRDKELIERMCGLYSMTTRKRKRGEERDEEI